MKQVIDDIPAVYLSEIKNPVINLANEESLLGSVQPGESLLFLYENDTSLIIGRFQNPWKECRTGLLRRHGIPLIRRISGGGTVVHGPGNLNLSFITGASVPDKEKNLNFIIRALSRICVKIEMNPRYDLMLRKSGGMQGDAYKVSGSAFRQKSGRSMHHATLLVNADLGKLGLYLSNPGREILSRSVPSNPSQVANLSDLSPGLKVSDVVDAIAAEWHSSGLVKRITPSGMGCSPESPSIFFDNSRQRLISEEWTWGKTPGFKELIIGLAGFEEMLFEIDIQKGRIAGIKSAAQLDMDFLTGCPYQGSDILNAYGLNPPEWLKGLARVVDGDGY